jgi:hypothetical protein
MNDQEIRKFAASVRSQVIGAGHAGYDDARKLHNAMINKRPLLIVCCADVDDVMASRSTARRIGRPKRRRPSSALNGELRQDHSQCRLGDLDERSEDPERRSLAPPPGQVI